MSADNNIFKLSGSTDGRRIKVAATSSPGTTIHTATSEAGDNSWDVIYLNAMNNHTAAVTLTLQWGGTSSPDDDIVLTLAAKSGLVAVILGDILHNSLTLKAHASTANVVTLGGLVMRRVVS